MGRGSGASAGALARNSVSGSGLDAVGGWRKNGVLVKGREAVDKLELRGLEVRCVIGDLPTERDREQVLTLDVTLACDLSAVCASDRVEDTVDYAVLAETIRDALRQARFRMIESAASRVAAVCLEAPRVSEVWVRIAKPGAVAGLREAAVELVRRRGDGAS